MKKSEIIPVTLKLQKRLKKITRKADASPTLSDQVDSLWDAVVALYGAIAELEMANVLLHYRVALLKAEHQATSSESSPDSPSAGGVILDRSASETG